MSVIIHSEEGQVIRQLIPLSTMPINQFESLCNIITVEVAEPDTFLFKRNDTANDLIFLIDGSITLQSNKLKVETVKSGTESSRFAIAHQIPRKIDAVSNTSIRYLRLSTDIINALPSISYEEDITYMVTDEQEDENDDDWMTTLLKSPIFKALPPANLQQIIMSLEEVTFNKGDLIIKQDDPGDYYYLIKKGHCLISRKPSANAKEIKLAQLRTQDTFGEDSLLSGEPRNVSITALTKISLLRLTKKKFLTLIKEPALKFISYSQLQDELDNGAVVVDVRPPDEYNKYHLPHSINAPFFSLRMQLKALDKTKPIIVVCENGKTSEASAFLLLRQRMDALILEGGMAAVPEDTKAPTAAAFEIDDGIETLTAEKKEPVTHGSEIEVSLDHQSVNDQSIEQQNESNSLQKENQKLTLLVKKLSAEKDDLKRKYLTLYKQTEKLKSILDLLKKDKGIS